MIQILVWWDLEKVDFAFKLFHYHQIPDEAGR